jgi:hypothetical protein
VDPADPALFLEDRFAVDFTPDEFFAAISLRVRGRGRYPTDAASIIQTLA